MRSTEFDQAVAALSRRQHGAVSRRQVLDLGGTDRMVASRVTSGRWLRLDPGVYGLAAVAPTWHQSLMAAQLSEPIATIAGRAAAALHGFEGFRPCRPEITVPSGAGTRSRIAIVHQLTEHQLTVIHSLRVLTVVDTLIHVAGLANAGRTRLAFDHLLASRRVAIEQVAQRFHQLEAGRRAGSTLMRAMLLERLQNEFEPPTSVLESLLYDVLDRPGMPAYVRQFRIAGTRTGGRVDAMVALSQLVIEADGRSWHTRLDDFARDRERDRRAAILGYRTLRFTWQELRDDPDRVQREILAAHQWAPAAASA